MAQQHVVQTTHIQRLIENGARLARLVHGKAPGEMVGEHRRGGPGQLTFVPRDHALQKAAADLRHAAEELEAERLSCLGWAQV